MRAFVLLIVLGGCAITLPEAPSIWVRLGDEKGVGVWVPLAEWP